MDGAVDPELFDLMVAATQHSESGNRDFDAAGRPVRSNKGALYRMQTMPATAEDPGFGVRPVSSQTPGEYNRVGREYLKAMLQRYRDPAKAWVAYNWGPGRLDNAIASHGDNWRAAVPRDVLSYAHGNVSRIGNAGPAGPLSVNAQTAAPRPDMASPDNSFAVTPGSAPAGPLAVRPNANSPLDDYWGKWQDTYDQSGELAKEEQAAYRDQFLRAAQALQQQNVGMSTGEKLMALSSALLSPTRVPGFKGVMMNVAPTLFNIAHEQQQARRERAAALAKLQGDYVAQSFGARRDDLSTRAGILKSTASAAGSMRPGTAQSPVTVDALGNVYSRKYGTQLKQPPYEALKALRDSLADTEYTDDDKATIKANFDKQFGYGAAETFLGGE